MNKFKDKNGVQWMSTTAASKFLRCPAPTIYGWKYTGDLKEGIHWTTDKFPPRKLYWNIDALAAYIDERYPGKYAVPKKAHSAAPQPVAASKTKSDIFSSTTVHATLTKEAAEAFNSVKDSLKIEVQQSLNGVVIARSTREPSMQMICNMLLVKGAEAYLAEQAA
jgi:hypothetical protein